MKTKIKLLARLLLVTLLFSFMGCSEDVYENHVHNKPIPLKNNISFEQFKRETGLSKFDTKIKINQNDDTVLNRNADGSYELSDFNIATDIIKRVDFDEKITYTFQIKPVVEVANGHFYNLTMFYKEGWQSLITELIPSVEHALELQQGTEEKFEGTMARLYQSDLPPNSVEACTTIFIYFAHCTHTGSCLSGTCDGCNSCVTTDIYTTCSTDPVGTSIEYIDLGGSTGGSGSADGATEPPFNNDIVIDPNLTDRSVFDDPNYINQLNTSAFYYNLDYNQQQWVNNNAASFNQLIQYQIANEWSDESEQFANEMLNLCITNNSSITIDNTINAENGLVVNSPQELSNLLNNFNNPTVTSNTTNGNSPNNKLVTVNFSFINLTNLSIDLNIQLASGNVPFVVNNLTSNMTGFTVFMHWNQNPSIHISSPNSTTRSITFTGTVSYDLVYNGVGNVWTDKYSITIDVNPQTGAVLGTSFIKI